MYVCVRVKETETERERVRTHNRNSCVYSRLAAEATLVGRREAVFVRGGCDDSVHSLQGVRATRAILCVGREDSQQHAGTFFGSLQYFQAKEQVPGSVGSRSIRRLHQLSNHARVRDTHTHTHTHATNARMHTHHRCRRHRPCFGVGARGWGWG